MFKTDFEPHEKKPLYVSPTVKEINIVTSLCILLESDQDMNPIQGGPWD